MNKAEAICVKVSSTKGSTPREVGAKLWVGHDFVYGSIGGGHMEFSAITIARKMLTEGQISETKEYVLGPNDGQCCGGVVKLKFACMEFSEPSSQLIAIFGAGHVGAYLARLARALDFEVRLFDDRPCIEIPHIEPYEAVVLPEREIENLPSSSKIVILTHDHGLDFLLAKTALMRGDFSFVGMIGSESKAARFRNHNKNLDFKNFHSPIAKTNLSSKTPQAIALDIIKFFF